MSGIADNFLTDMPDEQKLRIIVKLIKAMSPDMKKVVIQQLADDPVGEARVTVSSNDQFVRVDFEHPLAWFAIPKAHALQLGATLMQHAGATLQQISPGEKANA